MNREPQRGDKVLNLLGKERHGIVVGYTYIQDSLFIKVKFSDQKEWENPEEFKHESFFTQTNCGLGYWDQQKKCWIIEESESELPKDDSLEISFIKAINKFNIELLEKRIGEDTKLNLIQLEKEVISHRRIADECGIYNSYKNHYESKAKDYKNYLYYRLHGKLPKTE